MSFVSEEAVMELYVGGDLSRKRLDWFAVWPDGAECGQGAVSPDGDGLARLAGELGLLGERVCVVIESMTGARFVHDELESHGVEVRIADARRGTFAVELLGLARGAKTDRLDARRLAGLGRPHPGPGVLVAGPPTRAARELVPLPFQLLER